MSRRCLTSSFWRKEASVGRAAKASTCASSSFWPDFHNDDHNHSRHLMRIIVLMIIVMIIIVLMIIIITDIHIPSMKYFFRNCLPLSPTYLIIFTSSWLNMFRCWPRLIKGSPNQTRTMSIWAWPKQLFNHPNRDLPNRNVFFLRWGLPNKYLYQYFQMVFTNICILVKTIFRDNDLAQGNLHPSSTVWKK